MEMLNLKQLRERKGCTQEEAGRAANTSRDVVHLWENGKSRPRYFWNFLCLLRYYGVYLSQVDARLLEKALQQGVNLNRIKFKVREEEPEDAEGERDIPLRA